MENLNHTASDRKNRQLAGVIFDMDGVLVDSEPFIAEAAVRMFAEKGFTLQPEDFRPFIGMGEDRFLGGVAEARGVTLEMPRDKNRTYEIYLELIPGRLKPLPGVSEFIGRCRSLGLKLAVASSADRMKVEGNLRQLWLPSGTFDAIVVGEDIVHKKPAPDIFEEAARRLGLEPEYLSRDRGCCLGSTGGQGRREPLPGDDHIVFAEKLAAAGADWTAATLTDAASDVLIW